MTNRLTLAAACCAVLALAGCQADPAPGGQAPPPDTKSVNWEQTDPCALLTDQDAAHECDRTVPLAGKVITKLGW